MIIYVEKSQRINKTKTGTNSDYGKVEKYKVNIQKSIAFPYNQ